MSPTGVVRVKCVTHGDRDGVGSLQPCGQLAATQEDRPGLRAPSPPWPPSKASGVTEWLGWTTTALS